MRIKAIFKIADEVQESITEGAVVFTTELVTVPGTTVGKFSEFSYPYNITQVIY